MWCGFDTAQGVCATTRRRQCPDVSRRALATPLLVRLVRVIDCIPMSSTLVLEPTTARFGPRSKPQIGGSGVDIEGWNSVPQPITRLERRNKVRQGIESATNSMTGHSGSRRDLLGRHTLDRVERV
jgi:hypothetical protein